MSGTMVRNFDSKTEVDELIREIRELAASVGWEYKLNDLEYNDFRIRPVNLHSEIEMPANTILK